MLKNEEEKDYDVDKIWKDIKTLISELMSCFYPYLYHQYKIAFGEKRPHHFHIVGIDIILDQNLKAWFLESNDTPSMSITYIDDNEEEQISEIDLQLKYPVIIDALKLAVVSPEEANFYADFGIYERIPVN